jgi:hypothetical protein
MEKELEILFTLWFQRRCYHMVEIIDIDKVMALSNEAYEKILLDKWSHAKSKDKESTKGFFHLETLYYRFMDVFNKISLLFLLTLVASIISSMFSWIKHCKFLENISKVNMLRVRLFKFLKI